MEATAFYRLGKIECQKDTAKLLALAFSPRANAALKPTVCYLRNDNRQLVSDGTLAVYKKENLGQGAKGEMEEAGERNPKGAEGKPSSTFYDLLDRTDRLGNEDTLVLNVPIRVFITGT